MTKRELKELIKPLIRECVKEVIFQEGALSTIIKEVALGLSVEDKREVMVEVKQPKPAHAEEERGHARKLKEARKKMMDSIGSEAYGGQNLFEGTEPLRSAGSPGTPTAPASPLDGMSPRDPGVDISSLMPGLDKIWKKLM